MARADLHVHSKYSMDGDEWALKALGVRESYTEPEAVYRIAKLRKMDFVALTDHNTIEGAVRLALKHPQDTIVGCEFSVFFPEDGCKTHLLVYGLSEKHFHKIMALRFDIYAVRDYIRSEDLAYAVAHATLSVNGRLRPEVLEKLIVLFDVFESVNGAHSASHNRGWEQLLDRLTPGDIARFSEKHRIQPFGEDSWHKGLTGGSDDHAGLFIGQTFTVAPCRTREEFIHCLKHKKTFGFGRHHDPKAMALSLMLIGGQAWSHHSKSPITSRIFREIGRAISGYPEGEGWVLGLVTWVLKIRRTPFSGIFGDFLEEVRQHFRHLPKLTVDQRVHFIYTHLSRAIDLLIRAAIKALSRNRKRGAGMTWLKKGLLTAAFFGAPVFASLKVLSRGKDLVGRIRLGESGLVASRGGSSKRVLWFSDKIHLQKDLEEFFSKNFFPKNVKIKLAACSRSRRLGVSGSALALPMAGFLRQRSLSGIALRIPSVLEGLSRIEAWDPEEIVVETPGPTGLMGLLAARLLSVKCFRAFTPESWLAAYRFPNTEEKEALNRYLKIFCDLTDGPYSAIRQQAKTWSFSEVRPRPEPENLECV